MESFVEILSRCFTVLMCQVLFQKKHEKNRKRKSKWWTESSRAFYPTVNYKKRIKIKA